MIGLGFRALVCAMLMSAFLPPSSYLMGSGLLERTLERRSTKLLSQGMA